MAGNRISSPNEITKDINDVINLFKASKSFFIYIGPEYLGVQNAEVGPYNLGEGNQVYLKFNGLMTPEIRNQNNAVGHFLNQNFILRIYSVLNFHNVISDVIKIDQTIIPYWEDLDLLRRLRHKFGHGLGHYNREDGDDLKLWETIQKKYNPGIPETEDYAINQDKVIYPMINAILNYCKVKYQIENEKNVL